ncbi:DUF4921 family protein [Micrococcus sp.]|uniref:DUF4921 family protein n=1 Tax=Micrococcus sp. TaxID=1271 RepID=UPI0026DDB207|nr:DUF4921 family protein [Micrococcus sp.]MDO4239851.1 DUF4921 family protein [Micrococcus sp.]
MVAANEHAVPWRVMLKWRVSTLAGFEGATRINVNTISPWGVKERLVPRLRELREAGTIAAGIRIDGEARLQRNCLRYGRTSSRDL